MIETDRLIRILADDTPVADDVEAKAVEAARRRLRAAIAAERAGESVPRHRRRGRFIALFAALALIGVALPALGVGDWIGGGEIEGVRGSADPRLSGPPVVVPSGEAEQPWKIVIARSNQGLCLNVDVGDEQFRSERHRLGDCGYSDIRGDLPPDVRGDPSAACIGTTALVPCGSRPQYWVTARVSGSFVPEIQRSIFVGAAAADVASVELVLANGETTHAEFVERPLGPDVPLNVYWALLGPEHGLRLWRNAEGRLMPCVGTIVEMVVARDSEGRVLGRRLPAWNANPSGDPHGPRRQPDTECV